MSSSSSIKLPARSSGLSCCTGGCCGGSCNWTYPVSSNADRGPPCMEGVRTWEKEHRRWYVGKMCGGAKQAAQETPSYASGPQKSSSS
eukprot:scaffold205784_cov21-Tisochrysis_lutea.AAC.1